MPRINIGEVIYALSRETTLAVEDAMAEAMPTARYDLDALYRAFHSAIDKRCNRWATLPDKTVEV